MTPKEKFNKDVWYVLTQIKERSLYTKTGNPISYRVDLDSIIAGAPLASDEEALLEKLEELGAIKIWGGGGIGYESEKLFCIEMIQQKFDDIYSKFQNACDIDSWANTGQNKMVQNLQAGKDIDENVPEFLEVEPIHYNKKRDEEKKIHNFRDTKSVELWVNPIKRKIENGKIPYDKDGHIYSLWKYASARRLTGKKLITFADLMPLVVSGRSDVFYFLNTLQNLNIELENITFHENIYKKFYEIEHDYITGYAIKNPETNSGKAIKKLLNNQALWDDILGLLGDIDNLFHIRSGLEGMIEFIEFSSTPSEKNIKPLKNYLDAYLQYFIEDKLFSEDLKNFYKFSKQKEIFLDHIKTEVENYGSEFVFRQGEVISVSNNKWLTTVDKNASYLFIHTLAALEKQGLFEVERIFITDMDVPPEKQTDDYKVKIVASEKLLNAYKAEILRTQKSTGEFDPPLFAGGKTYSVDDKISTHDIFSISVKDREIWVNTWLISKPHGAGKNYEFFDYVRAKPPHTLIERDKMPNVGDGVNYGYTKEAIKNKGFIKILNELGFKSEILKAYFYKRSKDALIYRGDKITKEDLEKSGIKKPLFLKELELAHTRNSPE